MPPDSTTTRETRKHAFNTQPTCPDAHVTVLHVIILQGNYMEQTKLLDYMFTLGSRIVKY